MKSLEPYREERPWGEFVKFTENTSSTVKILTVKPGEAFSLQYHHKRDEFWRIISGNGMIQIGNSKHEAKPGMDYFIPRETNHRIEGGTEPLIILEIALDEFDENDVVRIEDRYGRS